MPELSDSETERIAHQLAAHLTEKKQAFWVEGEKHYNHHQWVDGQLSSEKDKGELMRKVTQSAVIWAVILMLGYSCKLIWKAFVTTVKTGI